jgi:hypothetical protein
MIDRFCLFKTLACAVFNDNRHTVFFDLNDDQILLAENFR